MKSKVIISIIIIGLMFYYPFNKIECNKKDDVFLILNEKNININNSINNVVDDIKHIIVVNKDNEKN